MDDVGRTGCASVLRPGDDVELRGMRARPYFRGRDVLDIGAGEGRLSLLLASIARSVVAIDPDAAAIAEGRRIARARGVRNVRFKVAAAQRPTVGAERFDTAVFSWSL